MPISVPYFIFTSGEKGLHGLDWGVKYVSPNWDKPETINRLYTDLAKQFGLSPGLKIPEKNGYGLILMPLAPPSQTQALMGVFWPYHDSKSQGRRTNIALICCKVPASRLRQKGITPDQVANALMRIPGFETLALRKEDRPPEYQHRPEHLNLDESLLESMEIESEKLPLWPSQTEAFVSISGTTERLTQQNKKGKSSSVNVSSPVFNNYILKTGVGFVMVLVMIGFYFINFGEPEKESNYQISQSGSVEKSVPDTVVNDSSIKKPPSGESDTYYQTFLDSTICLIRQSGAQKVTFRRDLFIEGRTIVDIEVWDSHTASKENFEIFTYVGIHPEKKILKPDAPACVLRFTIEEIFLDWNSATNRYRPLELVTRMPLDLLDGWPEKCQINLKSVPSKAVLKFDALPLYIDSHLKKFEKDKAVSQLQQSIAFLVPTNLENVYHVFYPDSDFKSISNPKGLLFPKKDLKYISMENFVSVFSELFERPNSDKKYWVVKSRYFQDQIIQVAVEPKHNETQSADTISESAIIEFLGDHLWKKM
jgi:hypothetical protein